MSSTYVIPINDVSASRVWYQHCVKWPFLGGGCEPRTSIYGNDDITLWRHLPHGFAVWRIFRNISNLNHPHPANNLSICTFFRKALQDQEHRGERGSEPEDSTLPRAKDAAYDLGPERDSTAAVAVKIAQSPLITFSFWEAMSSIPSKRFFMFHTLLY